jgi:hypothetical protein
MVSWGIEETNEAWGQEHLSRRVAPGCGSLTGFLAEDLFHQRKIIGAGGIAGWLNRPLTALRRDEH